MASTRNINNFNNYCHSQSELKRHRDYVIQPMKRSHNNPAYPNVGINAPQYMPNTELSKNSVDIESRLFGINATNLVNPQKPMYPTLRTLPTKTFFERPYQVFPQFNYYEDNQRPQLK
jgi:hypothetical protein